MLVTFFIVYMVSKPIINIPRSVRFTFSGTYGGPFCSFLCMAPNTIQYVNVYVHLDGLKAEMLTAVRCSLYIYILITAALGVVLVQNLSVSTACRLLLFAF